MKRKLIAVIAVSLSLGCAGAAYEVHAQAKPAQHEASPAWGSGTYAWGSGSDAWGS